MPFASEKIRLPETLDRRRALTTAQIAEIRALYKTGTWSWKQLAEEFGCSKSRIGQLVNSEMAERAKQRFKEHWRDYADKSKHTIAVREHRRYKQSLKVSGVLN